MCLPSVVGDDAQLALEYAGGRGRKLFLREDRGRRRCYRRRFRRQ